MGIPGFTGWFSDQEKAAYIPLDAIQATTGIDHLYIDTNSLLHNAIRNAK
jgi:5'-3' exonuclease